MSGAEIEIARGVVRVLQVLWRSFTGARAALRALHEVRSKGVSFGGELKGLETGLEALANALQAAFEAVKADAAIDGAFGEGSGADGYASIAMLAVEGPLRNVLEARRIVAAHSETLAGLETDKTSGLGARAEQVVIGLGGAAVGAAGRDVQAAFDRVAAASRRIFGGEARDVDSPLSDTAAVAHRAEEVYGEAEEAVRDVPRVFGPDAPGMWKDIELFALIADAAAAKCIMVAGEAVSRLSAQAAESGRAGGGLDRERELDRVRKEVRVEVSVLRKIKGELKMATHMIVVHTHSRLLSSQGEGGAHPPRREEGSMDTEDEEAKRIAAARRRREGETTRLEERMQELRAAEADRRKQKDLEREIALLEVRKWEEEMSTRETEFSPLVAELEDEEEQVEAARRVLNAAFAPEKRDVLFTTKGLVAGLVSLLTSGSAEGKTQAAAALWNIACGSESTKDGLFAHPGLVAGLVSLLTSGSEEGKTKAAAALWNIAAGSESTKDGLFAHPGLVAGLVLLLGSGSAEGKTFAAGALRNLSISRATARRLVHVPRLIPLLRSATGGAREHAQVALRLLGPHIPPPAPTPTPTPTPQACCVIS